MEIEVEKKSDEYYYCRNCNREFVLDECILEGAPISGTYYASPCCRKDIHWEDCIEKKERNIVLTGWVRVSELLSFIDYYDKSGVYPGHILSKLKNELSQSNDSQTNVDGSGTLPQESIDKGLEGSIPNRTVNSGKTIESKDSKPSINIDFCEKGMTSNSFKSMGALAHNKDGSYVTEPVSKPSLSHLNKKTRTGEFVAHEYDKAKVEPVSNKVTNVPVSLCETPKCPKCNCELDDSVFVPGIKVHKWGAKGCKWKDVEEYSLRRSE